MVGAYRLEHDERATGSALTGIGYTGYGAGGATRDLPALRLSYSVPAPDDGFAVAGGEALLNTPVGLTAGHRMVDLLGEGLAGILTEAGDAWYYKSNEGGGRFGPQRLVADRPAHRLRQVALVDFAADGNPKLATLAGKGAGYYTFDRDADAWLGFRPFAALPHLEAARHRAQWADLNNDGRAELMLADAEKVLWYPSLGGGPDAAGTGGAGAGGSGAIGFGDPVTVTLPGCAGNGHGGAVALVDRVINGRLEA